jgi:hypothetical protein
MVPNPRHTPFRPHGSFLFSTTAPFSTDDDYSLWSQDIYMNDGQARLEEVSEKKWSSKRGAAASDDLYVIDAPGSSSKRFKTDYLEPTPIKDTPMLLDRISSLGGGFPMASSLGGDASNQQHPMLRSYKSLWQDLSSDENLQEKMFRFKFSRGSVKML